MHICIFRRRFTPWGVDGTMVINGKFFCGTLERPQSYLKADAYRLALLAPGARNALHRLSFRDLS